MAQTVSFDFFNGLNMQDDPFEGIPQQVQGNGNPGAFFEVLKDANSVLITPAFRADWFRIVLLFAMLIFTGIMAYSFPGSLLRIPLFTLFGTQIGFVFPVLLIFPLIVLLFIIHRRLDTRYIVGKDRLIRATGLSSFRRRTREMYFTNVRGILVDQTVSGRLLSFGTIRIGPLIDGSEDILIEGIRNPFQYKSLLERRLQALSEGYSVETLSGQQYP